MNDIQPVHGIPALTIGHTLVIGDMHIGVETHLMRKGFHITSRTDEMLDTILGLSDDCNRLVVLGDVKDTVPGSSKQEYREIPDFFEKLLETFDIIDVVRGNHDTNIEEFLPTRVRVAPASGLVVDGVGLVHGHKWPSDAVMDTDVLVMAHNHPAVMFRDGVGKQTTEPCWMRGRFKDWEGVHPREYIVVPAFNRMLGGSPVNIEGEGFLGPIMNSDIVDVDSARLFLLDGIDLGTRSSLMIPGRSGRRNLRKLAMDQ